MAKEWDPETVFDVLGDEAVRRVLAATNVQAASVRTLADGLDVSEPTVYRRVDTCRECDLLTEETRVDPDDYWFECPECESGDAQFVGERDAA